MQHRHMGGRRPHGFHILIKLAIVFLIVGALFSRGGHGSRSAYWEGFRDGALSAQSAESGAPVQVVPPFGSMDGMTRGFGGPGWGALFLLPLCGLAVFVFMGVMFSVARRAGRHARHGRHGPWGRGRWYEDDTTKGRAVDEDDEIGPEKDPNDYL